MQLIETCDKGFKEDNRYTDLKIVIALIACVLGAVSHFYPIPFPKNKPLLALCVLGYVLCASAYYYIEKHYEGDAFFITRANSVSKLKDFQRVRFSSDLDSTSEPGHCHYKLKICARSQTGAQGLLEVERRCSVTELYDEGGYLHRYRVKQMFDETMHKFINA